MLYYASKCIADDGRPSIMRDLDYRYGKKCLKEVKIFWARNCVNRGIHAIPYLQINPLSMIRLHKSFSSLRAFALHVGDLCAILLGRVTRRVLRFSLKISLTTNDSKTAQNLKVHPKM